MAKAKSTSGGKTSRAKTNPTPSEQTTPVTAASAPDVKAPVETTPIGIAAEARVPAVQARVTPEPKVILEPKVIPEPKLTPEPRKIEMVKSEPRKNVVAINRAPVNLEDEIRRRAYELYQQRGNAAGSEAEDWLKAEREVRKRYQQHSA
jgi:hypothetical protein